MGSKYLHPWDPSKSGLSPKGVSRYCPAVQTETLVLFWIKNHRNLSIHNQKLTTGTPKNGGLKDEFPCIFTKAARFSDFNP